jgi:hypothetical protein
MNMRALITVAMVMLERDFGRYGIIFMNVCAVEDLHVFLNAKVICGDSPAGEFPPGKS